LAISHSSLITLNKSQFTMFGRTRRTQDTTTTGRPHHTGGLALKGLQTIIRCLQFCCAGLILALFSYFLAVLADRDLNIAAWKKAVEGMSGAACLYTIFAILLTCFLGGITFFAFLGTILDICFIGCFVAIAVLTRSGAHSCSGMVHTPLGYGNADTGAAGYGSDGFGVGSGKNVTYAPNLKQACRMQKACFAVAIIAAFLFLVSLLLDFFMARHHQKEKRYGPGPNNDYTSGSGRRGGLFSFRRNKSRKVKTTRDAEARDAELAAAGAGTGGYEKHHHNANGLNGTTGTAGTHNTVPATTYEAPNTYEPTNTYAAPAGIRPSHDTAYSGATQTENYGYGAGAHNPYKYDNNATTGTNY